MGADRAGTRILLVDDDASVRAGIRELLALEAGFDVVAEAADGIEAVRLARDLRPNVVLMDVAMPNLNGVVATRRILADAPAIKVIAISMHADPPFREAMLEAGAVAFVPKDEAGRLLARTIRQVAKPSPGSDPDESD